MRRLAAATALVLALSWSASAHAEGFALNRFDGAERGSDLFVLDTLDLRGHLRPAAGVVGEWGYRSLSLYDASGQLKSAVVRSQFLLHPGASLVLWERLRAGVDVPVQLFADGEQGSSNGVTYPAPSSEPALSDVRLSADARIFGEYAGPAELALGVAMWVPTGSPAAYTGEGSARVAPRALLAGANGEWVYAAKLAFLARPSSSFAGSSVGSEVELGVGGGLRLWEERLLASLELAGATGVDDPFKVRTTPLEATLGLRAFFQDELRVFGGLGAGLSRGLGTPLARGLLGVEYVPRAHSHIPTPPPREPDAPLACDHCVRDDVAVDEAPVLTGGAVAAAPDADGDGVPDGVDACPALFGVEQTNAKHNGCPPDSDEDGINDEEDACPDVVGAHTSDPKTNGCAGAGSAAPAAATP